MEILAPFDRKNTIFKSAMAPLKLCWKARSEDDNKEKNIEFIYKTGDDLR